MVQVSAGVNTDKVEKLGATSMWGAILILLWAGTLATVITLRRQKPYEGDWRQLYWFEAFYRIGSIIFGGGQVTNLIAESKWKCRTIISQHGTSSDSFCTLQPKTSSNHSHVPHDCSASFHSSFGRE